MPTKKFISFFHLDLCQGGIYAPSDWVESVGDLTKMVSLRLLSSEGRAPPSVTFPSLIYSPKELILPRN